MGPETFTVGQLNDGIADALSSWFPAEVWVEGEIFSLSRSQAGHVYFQLIEPGEAGAPPRASIPVALFASARAYVNQVLKAAGGVRMTDGMRVRLRGRVEIFTGQGKVQLRMSGIDPDYTLGLLATERERILRVLTTEGLIGRNRTRVLPPGPLRVGLVTSNGSVAMADFMHELETSELRWQVTLADARVQGAGAERSVLAALERLEASQVDVIALVRGGGARTDLATFDSELVARAIAHTSVPVITGIGHESDRAVADLVAHTACKTPTACAATLVAHVRESHDRAEQCWDGLLARAEQALEVGDAETRRAAVAVSSAGRGRLQRHDQALIDHGRRLRRETHTTVLQATTALDLLAVRLEGLDPQRTLARGWSITRTATGTVVRDADQLRPGDVLLTTLRTGEVRSLVTTSDPEPSP